MQIKLHVKEQLLSELVSCLLMEHSWRDVQSIIFCESNRPGGTLSNTYVIPQPLKCPVYSRLPSFPQHHFKLGPLEQGSLWNYLMLLWIKTWIFLKFKTVPSALASPSPSPLFPFVSQGFLSIHQVFWSAKVTGTVQLAGEVTTNGNEDLVAKVHLLRSFWHLQSSVLNEGQIKII